MYTLQPLVQMANALPRGATMILREFGSGIQLTPSIGRALTFLAIQPVENGASILAMSHIARYAPTCQQAAEKPNHLKKT